MPYQETHECWLNEPRICEDCYNRVCKERDEARAALMDAVNNWRHSDDSHARFHDDKMLVEWKRIANIGICLKNPPNPLETNKPESADKDGKG